MKRFYFYLIWAVLLLFHNPILAQLESKKKVVLIDPGHGGLDYGAMGINEIREKDVVLKVAKEVVRLNREMYNDTLEIYLSRYSDTLISLRNRTKLARALKVDVFVSIHCNQATRDAAQGIEVFVQRPTRKSNTQIKKKSEKLARLMVKGFHESLGFKIRGVKYNNFQVLRETQNVCPSVLLELGFLSNSEEARHNGKESSLTAYALSILQTILNFDYVGNL